MADKLVILAVDDNIQQLSEFKSILSLKYDLRTVKAASEAISFLNKNKIDLILLDIDMPNISGFEFLGDIRKIPSYFLTPIIIVSGTKGQEFLNEANNSSANAVLIKPVIPNVLIDTIEQVYADAENTRGK
ncbi:MAG: response regulator [Treponema sp.]|nr:response regulator [Treponema sp.]MCL2250833.1 response regulator [Treponema sp.]